MVTLYSPPDIDLLRRSSNVLWSCQPQGDEGLTVIPVKYIQSVVAMVPFSVAFLGQNWADWVFVVEKPGLDVADMGGYTEDDNEESQ